jgi:hypothetical protein
MAGPTLDPATPPTLPSLTHADIAAIVSDEGAVVARDAHDDATTFLWVTHLELESALVTRNWHAGAAWDLSSATDATGDRTLLGGNPEVWARGTGYFEEAGISAGGGLGVIIPVPRATDGGAEGALQVVRAVRPWDARYFSSRILTARPFFDVRLVEEPVVLQLRQGFDLSYGFDTQSGDIIERVGVYAGWEIHEPITIGLELWQTYSMTADVTDAARAAFTLSPSIRAKLGPIEPALSLLFPLSTPLEGVASSFFGVRLHVRLALGKTADVTYEP